MRPIYVEILIRGSMEDVWSKTQTPELHQQWDVRFSSIKYLPRNDPSAPQRFLYRTRIGFGMEISGEGETTGQALSETNRTSALKFWSADPKSLIHEGSGYWKYIQVDNGIRFLTWYDYTTRFGTIGRILDLLIFRPLLGWATAWSFDRLRLWIEREITPGISRSSSMIHWISRISIGIIWIYQGLIPKILFSHPDELKMLMQTGLSQENSVLFLTILGVAEVLFGSMFITFRRIVPLLLINIVLMVAALLMVVTRSPEFVVAAFNPVSLNTALIGLSLTGWISNKETVAARKCLRRAVQAS